LALSTGCEGKAAAGNRFRIFGRGPARKGWHSNRASARFFLVRRVSTNPYTD
jgi:hypothetical protein